MTILVSICALGFTVGTFWWNNWRQGKLSVDIPRSYSAYQGKDRFLLMLPIAISNSGPIPIVVSALRLRMELPDNQTAVIPYVKRRPELAPSGKNEPVFATNFTVKPRDASIMFCEFHRDRVAPLKAGHNSVKVEALAAGGGRWQQIGDFELHVSEKHERETMQCYWVVHDNAEALPGLAMEGDYEYPDLGD